MVEFDNSYDHTNFDTKGLSDKISSVKVSKTQENPNGKSCGLHEWATVTYKGYLKGAETEEGKKVFRLGHYEVSMCWDIAL